jgi:hypothetical protein
MIGYLVIWLSIWLFAIREALPPDVALTEYQIDGLNSK